MTDPIPTERTKVTRARATTSDVPRRVSRSKAAARGSGGHLADRRSLRHRRSPACRRGRSLRPRRTRWRSPRAAPPTSKLTSSVIRWLTNNHARTVEVRQGGIAYANADDITVNMGGVALARADRINVELGGLGVVRPRSAPDPGCRPFRRRPGRSDRSGSGRHVGRRESHLRSTEWGLDAHCRSGRWTGQGGPRLAIGARLRCRLRPALGIIRHRQTGSLRAASGEELITRAHLSADPHRPEMPPVTTLRAHPCQRELEVDVSVGPGTSIWDRAQVRDGARIGRDCVIGRDVFIDHGVSVGDRVKVQNGGPSITASRSPTPCSSGPVPS